MEISMDLFLGLMPFLNLIFFQFVSAPSPDLPIFNFSQIIFYRFFLPLIIGMMVYMLAKFFLNQKKGILVFLFVTSLIPVTALFVPIFLKNLKTYPNSAESIHPFDFKNSIIPPKNSGKNLSYKTKMEGNLQFQTPINENPNFWFLTGDGPLPCVHENLIIFWKKTFQMRPQMRTEFLKNGFKSEKIKE